MDETRRPWGCVVTMWSKQEDEDLARMRREGQSFGVISSVLKKSRNACIGRALRLNLPRAVTANPTQAQEPKRQAVKASVSPSLPQKVAVSRPCTPPPPPSQAYAPEASPTRRGWPKPRTATAVHFLQIPSIGLCRMPLWGDDAPLDERFYCGAPTTGGTATYCQRCRLIAFTTSTNPLAPRRAS